MTPTAAAPHETDGFLDLARLSWLANPPSPAPNPLQERLINTLAQLLRAASNGTGALTLSHLHLSNVEIAAIKAHPQFFAIEHDLLLLPRYASHLSSIRAFFSERLASSPTRFADSDVRQALDQLLPAERITDSASGRLLFDNAQQRLAIAALVDARVGLLTGGPGTGKTTTAAVLLALHKRLNPALSAESILVTAPTGKAACRIAEAITKAIGHIRELCQEEQDFLRGIRSITLHKALEWSPLAPENGGPFRRGPHRPIEAKIVLVDEASMVDLSLMFALIQALPADTSLLLLGDSDQLESVEVGGILSELVQRASRAPLPADSLKRMALRLGCKESNVEADFLGGLPIAAPSLLTPLPGLMLGLKYSRRAMNAPWILELANIVRPGAAFSFVDWEALFQNQQTDQLHWYQDRPGRKRSEICKTQWLAWAKSAAAWCGLSSSNSEEALHVPLRQLLQFQLLCSSNAQVDRANLEGLAPLWGSERPAQNALPHGCPIIVQANSHTLGLSNGDVGIALGNAPHQPATLALFASGNGAPRLIPLAQLPAHRPAFALTIHKSQGSEWEHIAIELPAEIGSAILSRNLLYTAITRSSRRIDIFGTPPVLIEIMAERPRHSEITTLK